MQDDKEGCSQVGWQPAQEPTEGLDAAHRCADDDNVASISSMRSSHHDQGARASATAIRTPTTATAPSVCPRRAHRERAKVRCCAPARAAGPACSATAGRAMCSGSVGEARLGIGAQGCGRGVFDSYVSPVSPRSIRSRACDRAASDGTWAWSARRFQRTPLVKDTDRSGEQWNCDVGLLGPPRPARSPRDLPTSQTSSAASRRCSKDGLPHSRGPQPRPPSQGEH